MHAYIFLGFLLFTVCSNINNNNNNMNDDISQNNNNNDTKLIQVHGSS